MKLQSLDSQSSQRIWSWLLDRASQDDIALVWISHKSEEQNLPIRQLAIENGQIIEDSKGGCD